MKSITTKVAIAVTMVLVTAGFIANTDSALAASVEADATHEGVKSSILSECEGFNSPADSPAYCSSPVLMEARIAEILSE